MMQNVKTSLISYWQVNWRRRKKQINYLLAIFVHFFSDNIVQCCVTVWILRCKHVLDIFLQVKVYLQKKITCKLTSHLCFNKIFTQLICCLFTATWSLNQIQTFAYKHGIIKKYRIRIFILQQSIHFYSHNLCLNFFELEARLFQADF